MYESYEALKVSRVDNVVRVMLDNLPMNGMKSTMHNELSTVFARINADKEARVAVITGAGDRAFCAGGDPNELASGPKDNSAWLQTLQEARDIVLSMLSCDVPIIARLNGHAVGVGATIALCADITVMVDRAKIGDTHVKIGLSAGDGGALLWPNLVNLPKARRYLLTGDLMTGSEAAEIGLITEAVSQEELDGRVDDWVQRFCAMAPLALRMTKRSLNMALRQQAQAYMDAHLGLENQTYISADFREAGAAMLEKREPVFRGC